MSTYTMTLAEIVEDLAYGEYYENSDEKIEIGRKKLFDFDYPIFDKDYKKVFETNFIRSFYMREIGFETDGLFKFQLETWLRIHMPYFNKMYESELIEFDPLINSHVNVSAKKLNERNQNDNRNINQKMNNENSSDSSANSNTDSTATNTTDDFEREVISDTPDNRLQLSANDGESVIEYASKIKEENENSLSKSNGNEKVNASQKVTDKGSTQGESKDNLESKINDVEDYIQERAGKIGVQTYSEMVMKYRASFLRIERDIFKEMQQLFMLVY